MVGPLREWVGDIVNSKEFANTQVFNVKNIQKAFSSYEKANEIENSFHIWQWVSLHTWFEEFMGEGGRTLGTENAYTNQRSGQITKGFIDRPTSILRSGAEERDKQITRMSNGPFR